MILYFIYPLLQPYGLLRAICCLSLLSTYAII